MIDAIIHKTALLSRSAFAADVVPQPGGWVALQELGKVVDNLVVIALALGGLACFAMLLAGGLAYLTAGGDDKAIKKAKDTLTYAVAGLVLVVSAWLILNTVFVDILKLPHIEFTLP